MSTADVLALAESPFAHRTEEQSYRSGKFQFRQVRYANIVGLLGEAPAGAVVNRPEIHHDDHEVCWVISGRIHLTLPHEVCDLGPGQSIQFDAVLEHTYAAIEDSRFIILHLRKDKRY
jgi:mannose-6-phosphate isomerase-like protein (cupin superfamily)